MSEWNQVKKEEDSLSGWQLLAVHKNPKNLVKKSLFQVANFAANNYLQSKDSFRSLCHMLKTSLPMKLRTAIVTDIVSSQQTANPDEVMSLILLHLLTDVKHFRLTVRNEPGNVVLLEEKQCDHLLQEIRDLDHFSLESFQLEGVEMERGVLSDILHRSPRVRSIHVSGNLCSEVLLHLQEYSCNLLSLELDSCMVQDKEVVEALLGKNNNIETVGKLICEGGNVLDTTTITHNSLCHLSVQSPLLTVCGAMVLLCCLKKLNHFQYTCWNSNIFDSMRFIQQMSPHTTSFSLTSMVICAPNEEAIMKLTTFCPGLRSLIIEHYDPSLKSLEGLSSLCNLKALTLHVVTEDHIVSALKVIGSNLLELSIEFDTCAFHTISFETLKTIQECCTHLHKLTLRNVAIKVNPREPLPFPKIAVFPELEQLTLFNVVASPHVLERMIVGSKNLENLILDVNQDGLTDPVLATILKHNSLDVLNAISFGGGFLSPKTITTLLALPALTRLSLDLKQFPFIPASTFNTLQDDLLKGSFQCVLENITYDE